MELIDLYEPCFEGGIKELSLQGVELVPETGRELVAFSHFTIPGLYCIYNWLITQRIRMYAIYGYIW